MGWFRRYKTLLSFIVVVGPLCVFSSIVSQRSQAAKSEMAAAKPGCPNDDSGLKLPAGFCATVFADGIGHARHMVAAANGVLYVNTWSGRYYGDDMPHAGGFLVALQDKTGAGKADVDERFGETVQSGGHGGTGIGLYKEFVYAESNDRIVRYALAGGAIVPGGAAETIVSGLPLTGDHPMHPFIIDSQGAMYVDVASATNSCQAKNRTLKSPGIDPCTELETRGGTWKYDANKTGQTFSPAERYATGIRNGEGFAFDAAGRLFVTQHGRDQLHTNWPEFYKPDQEATLPAEEVVSAEAGRGLWLAGVLLRLVREETGAGAGIRRRREEDWRLRAEGRTGGGISGALGAERNGALRQGTISGALPQWIVYRVSRIVEPGAICATGVQRGVSADGGRARRGTLRDFCGRIRGSGEVAGYSGTSS